MQQLAGDLRRGQFYNFAGANGNITTGRVVRIQQLTMLHFERIVRIQQLKKKTMQQLKKEKVINNTLNVWFNMTL